MIKEKIKTPYGLQLIEQLNKKYAQESVDHTDGLKLKRNRTWALIRASGTEPLVRVMVDAEDSKTGLALFEEIENSVSEILKKISH